MKAIGTDVPSGLYDLVATIDDGDAIGITETFDPNQNRAVWYFGHNEKRAGRFRDISNSLLNGSIPYQQFKERWIGPDQ